LEPRNWRTLTKLLLAFITVWPIIYIALFVSIVFSGLLYGVLDQRHKAKLTSLDVTQLEKKIENGEIIELRINGSEVEAIDAHGQNYEMLVSNPATRRELIRQAEQLDSYNFPRVPKIDLNSSRSPSAETLLPIGFGVLFLLHVMTMILLVLLMIFYLVVALKDERHDQTARIIWIILIVMMGVLADLVYWYLYIWREPRPAAAPVPAGS
jgi:hypothetical protein